jgi:AAA+ superfamily predicted ATPase
VFSGGCWQRSRELWQAIQQASFELLVLAGDLGERLRADFEEFLAARADYERWGVPWKRGALFVGHPGTGKTMCIKSLVRHLGLPVLYVQSFKSSYQPEQSCIRDVFARARRVAPCVLVLEDLDALVTAPARSFFLNELDGFAANQGIVTIGSTNHPEKLDPALVDRPSRFDRKYHFDLPAAPERRRYLEQWNGRVAPEMRLDARALDSLADATAGFSFAYLKELFAASLMRFASGRGKGTLAEVAAREAVALRAQMTTTNVVPEVATAPDVDAGDDEALA